MTQDNLKDGLWQRRALLATTLLALAVTAVLRLSIGREYPLWLDETWTGALSAERDLRTLFGDILNDANAPLFYLVSWLWAGVFGVSDTALRSLAAVFGLIAPLIVLSAPLDRTTRWTWCALLACWVEGLVYSQDARCYTLLLLLSAASACAFLRLLQAPSTRRATWWCALSGLTILTHYYAALPALAQGAAYVAVHRRAAWRTWPAALVLAPVLGWMALHIPHVLLFARSDVAWYALVRGDLAWTSVQWVYGKPKAILLLSAAMAAAAIRAPGPAPEQRAPWLVFLAALAAAGLMLGLGALRPSFTERYLCACVPGLLLGPVLVCTDPRRRFRAAPVALVGAALLGVFAWAKRHEMPFQHHYSFEAASAWMDEANPREVAFLWDHPATKVEAPAAVARVGGFFFTRARSPAVVRALSLPPDTDPNDVLAQAASRPNVATLWIYDVLVRATAARRWPPRPLAGHECRNFGRGWIGIWACRPQPERASESGL